MSKGTKRALAFAQRLGALIQDAGMSGEPESIEVLAHRVWLSIDRYANDVAWLESYRDDDYEPDAWVGIQIEGYSFHVGWGEEDEPCEPFDDKPTIGEALQEALRKMAQTHALVLARKKELEDDDADQG